MVRYALFFDQRLAHLLKPFDQNCRHFIEVLLVTQLLKFREITKSVKITNASVSSYVVSDLAPATWYFSVKAYNTKNVESDFSAKVSKTIT